MRTCPRCRVNYPDETEFCPRDGSVLPLNLTAADARLATALSQRFRVLRRLGAGGMGTVFLAEQIHVGDRRVALKVVHRRLLDDPTFLGRFRDEVVSTGRIHHPNVVTVYESGEGDDNTPYMAMEYLEGSTLRELLRSQGALACADAVDVLRQVSRALNAAHVLGIIHRDIKPDNIFLVKDEDGRRIVKVMDFGLAKLGESSVHTNTGFLFGTPAYMSYEQVSGMRSDQLDARSDLYSLGIVAYEMLTGRVPFHSDTPLGFVRQHLSEEPPSLAHSNPQLAVPELEAVVRRALDKDRDRRFRTVLEFSRAFTDAAATAPALQATVLVTTRPTDSGADGAAAVPFSGEMSLEIQTKPPQEPKPTGSMPNQTPPIPGRRSPLVAAAAAILVVAAAASAVLIVGSAKDPSSRPSANRMVSIPGQPFSMDSTEVTNDEYRAFVVANPQWQKRRIDSSLHDGDYLKDWNDNEYPQGKGAYPVVFVSWFAAEAFARWAVKRLPTEKEWEMAARAGTTGAYWWGDTFDVRHANLNGREPEPVGRPGRDNKFGLFDMSGNVWEWTGTSDMSATRVVRGGSWKDEAVHLRSDSRVELRPTITGPDLGFRCAK